MNDHISTTTRRALLQKLSALALVPATAPLGVSLLGMANAAAETATDYKALVCIFLNGGNDHYNTVVAYDQDTYNSYFKYRSISGKVNPLDSRYSDLAILRDALKPTLLASTVGLPSGRQMALGPTMGGIKKIFDAGRAAILLNVGTLIEPTNRDTYNRRTVRLPGAVFSHTQSQTWQASGNRGWGGRMADLVLLQNTTSKLTSISVGSTHRFLSGNARAYQIGLNGPPEIAALAESTLFSSASAAKALKALVRSSSGHLMETEYAGVMGSAIDFRDQILARIGVAEPEKFKAWFPKSTATNLSTQLKMVARMIEQGPALGLKRQVFMVNAGGFDTHSRQVQIQPDLIERLSDAMLGFDTALMAMGLADKVTAFTGSDFGRALTFNGDGTDHGWGSHHFIMGGAVKGNRFLGVAPEVGRFHTQDATGGRLVPTTSIEQLSAELARWFGVADSDQSVILPNSKNFDLYKLGIF
ncbi:MAG: hypothetical protein RJB34_375 [Pseudomonadota bacterium]|jgi:uncharacterized protein (DUF1501 family)